MDAVTNPERKWAHEVDRIGRRKFLPCGCGVEPMHHSKVTETALKYHKHTILFRKHVAWKYTSIARAMTQTFSHFFWAFLGSQIGQQFSTAFYFYRDSVFLQKMNTEDFTFYLTSFSSFLCSKNIFH